MSDIDSTQTQSWSGLFSRNRFGEIRDFDQEKNQAELIDAPGWSIHIARDGLEAAHALQLLRFQIHEIEADSDREQLCRLIQGDSVPLDSRGSSTGPVTHLTGCGTCMLAMAIFFPSRDQP